MKHNKYEVQSCNLKQVAITQRQGNTPRTGRFTIVDQPSKPMVTSWFLSSWALRALSSWKTFSKRVVPKERLPISFAPGLKAWTNPRKWGLSTVEKGKFEENTHRAMAKLKVASSSFVVTCRCFSIFAPTTLQRPILRKSRQHEAWDRALTTQQLIAVLQPLQCLWGVFLPTTFKGGPKHLHTPSSRRPLAMPEVEAQHMRGKMT